MFVALSQRLCMFFRKMPRVKYTARKDSPTVAGDSYAPAPCATFPTVAATSSGPRVAHVARDPPVVISDDEDTGSAARGELMPPPQNLLPTPSSGHVIRPARVSCVDPCCSTTFATLRNMRRHALQFHKLRGDGGPATEAEHEAAVLGAAKRTAWVRGGTTGHAGSRKRPQHSVETEVKRMITREQSGDLLVAVDPPDRPDELPRSVWVAAIHRAFGCPKVSRSVESREGVSDRRPEDRAPVSYLHRLLTDKPTLPIRDIV